jgi:hypothetical protein
MSISKIRSFLYWLAKVLGDINAIRKGTTLKRIKNRIVGKVCSKKVV